MRVLHIVPGKIFGGVETIMVSLARFRYACPAMTPEFALCFEGRLAQELLAAGVQVHWLGNVRAHRPLSVWRARRCLKELLRRRHYDVVMCHMPWVQAIFGPVVRDERIPLVYGARGPSSGRHWTERWAGRCRPDLAVCVSDFVVAEVAKIYPGIPTETVYNPVPPSKALSYEERLAVRAESNTAADAVVIAQACRMEPGKGHRVCLEALHLLRHVPGWECWQIGGPQRAVERDYLEGLRQYAAELGIAERVRFRGQRTDVPRLLGAADIYCQPNDTFLEGLGNSFIEAMWAGLPVVTTAIGAAPEVVDNSCGFLLPPGAMAALAATLEKLIREPDLRARLGAGGPPRAKRVFAPELQIPRLHRALGRAVAAPKLGADREKIRVLHISAGKLYGGVETLLLTLARLPALSPAMEPEFAVCFEGRLSRELAAAGAPVHSLGALRVRYPISVWRARRKLSELLRPGRFHVVVCHMAWAEAVFGPAVRSMRVPLVFWLHEATAGRHWTERWARLTRPDLTICNSRFTQAAFESFAPSLRSEVIYCPLESARNGFAQSDRIRIRASLNTSASATVIVQVSRMENWKGHRVHLRALAKLRHLDGWVCWMVGGPQRAHEASYFRHLQSMAEELGIEDRVIFLGQRADVADLLLAADIFCQPNSRPEPFGISFVEALYAGLPVITSELGGGLEIVDRSCGILVPPHDEDSLARSLEDLIAKPEFRARLGSAGPGRASRLCDPSAQMNRLSGVLAEAISTARDEAQTPN